MKKSIFSPKKCKKIEKKGDFCKFSVHPVSIVVWIWLCVVLGMCEAISYFFAILFHELAHVLMARRLGYCVKRFAISPYGFSLSFDEKNFDLKHEFLIAFSGPAANLLSALFCVALWWIFPETYFFTAPFAEISTLLALFNLLPCHPLDGGRVFVCIASFFISTRRAKQISCAFNLVLGTCFFALFIQSFFVDFNPSFLLFSLFLFCGLLDIVEGTKFEKFNFFTKKTRNFASADVIFVNLSVSLGQIVRHCNSTKPKIFCLALDSGKTIFLSETAVKNLLLKFDFNTKLSEIFADTSPNKKLFNVKN